MPTAAYAGPGTPDYDPVFYYYHPDHLGSSQLMTDRDGDVVQQYGYSPFGREDYKNNTLAFSVSNRYTGQTLDEETGLYYYGARYYDPELARFIQADSTVPDGEFSQAYNRYAYVYNNPLKFTDPTGQNPFLIAWAIVEAVGAVLTTEVTVMGMTMAAWQLGLIAGTVNAIIAGATGGNPLTAFAAGFIGGVAGGNWGVPGSIAAGAIGGVIQGGDPMMGAVTAGISAGVAAVCQQTPLASIFDGIEDKFLKELVVSTASGALAGGVTAEMFGGDFGQGAATGAASGAAGYVLTRTILGFFKQQAVPVLGSPPNYDPALWNDPRYMDVNNCYSYAVDDPVAFPQRTFTPQPGNAGGSPLRDVTVSDVTQAAIADGLRYLGPALSPTTSVAPGEHVVALVVDPGKDYHWYRQNPNGTWSHKRGITEVRNVDASNRRIVNPNTADRNYGRTNYREWGGYFAVPAGGVRVR
jgi:RHS repeat-associated protein